MIDRVVIQRCYVTRDICGMAAVLYRLECAPTARKGTTKQHKKTKTKKLVEHCHLHLSECGENWR